MIADNIYDQFVNNKLIHRKTHFFSYSFLKLLMTVCLQYLKKYVKMNFYQDMDILGPT